MAKKETFEDKYYNPDDMNYDSTVDLSDSTIPDKPKTGFDLFPKGLHEVFIANSEVRIGKTGSKSYNVTFELLGEKQKIFDSLYFFFVKKVNGEPIKDKNGEFIKNEETTRNIALPRLKEYATACQLPVEKSGFNHIYAIGRIVKILVRHERDTYKEIKELEKIGIEANAANINLMLRTTDKPQIFKAVVDSYHISDRSFEEMNRLWDERCTRVNKDKEEVVDNVEDPY